MVTLKTIVTNSFAFCRKRFSHLDENNRDENIFFRRNNILFLWCIQRLFSSICFQTGTFRQIISGVQCWNKCKKIIPPRFCFHLFFTQVEIAIQTSIFQKTNYCEYNLVHQNDIVHKTFGIRLKWTFDLLTFGYNCIRWTRNAAENYSSSGSRWKKFRQSGVEQF